MKCELWEGGVTSAGYGSINNVLAHRTAYEKANGPIPDGLVIDHLCRNTLCINPDHLEAVPHKENIRRAPTSCQVHDDWYPPESKAQGCRTCQSQRSRAHYLRSKSA